MEYTAIPHYVRPHAEAMKSLAPGKKLNDLVINAYLRLLERRSHFNPSLPSMWAAETYFFCSLKKRGYAGVKRATITIDVVSKDLLLIPVFIQGKTEEGNHWYLIEVDQRRGEISAFDSVKGWEHRQDLQAVQRYMDDLYKSKNLPVKAWQIWGERTCAHQSNKINCGVFLCHFAEILGRGERCTNQKIDVAAFRRQMVEEIQNGATKPFFKVPTTPAPKALPQTTTSEKTWVELCDEVEDWTLEQVMEDVAKRLVPPELISPLHSPVEDTRIDTTLLQNALVEVSTDNNARRVYFGESGPSTEDLKIVHGKGNEVEETHEQDSSSHEPENQKKVLQDTTLPATFPSSSRPTTLDLKCTSDQPKPSEEMDLSPVLSLTPGSSLASSRSASLEELKESCNENEDNLTVLPMDIDEESETWILHPIEEEQNKEEKKEEPDHGIEGQLPVERMEPWVLHPIEEELGKEEKKKKKRRGGKRRTIKVPVPGTDRFTRVNVLRLGLPKFNPRKSQ